MFEADWRVEAEGPLLDGWVDADGPLDGRVDAEGPFPLAGRVDADGPLDGLVDAEAPPFDGWVDGRLP